MENNTKKLAISFIVVALVLVIGSLTIIRVNKKNQPAILPAAVQKQQSGKAASLTLDPRSLRVLPQQPFTVNVMVDTKGNAVSGVDLKIVFDPDKIFLNNPQLGEFFNEPVVFENSVDNKRGLLSLSLGSPGQADQSKTLVTLQGVVKSGVSGETDLIILPESKVIDAKTASSILGNTSGTTLTIMML